MRGFFAKYLSEAGWDIKVVTAARRKGCLLDWVYDDQLYERLKEEIEIVLFPALVGTTHSPRGRSSGEFPADDSLP